MKLILVDTNGWIALNSKRDQFHESALKMNRKLLYSGYRYVTTNFILDETYTGLRMKVGHYAAVDFGEKIRKSKSTNDVYIDKNIEEQTWELFKKYSDKEFSYTDCTSFVILNQFRINEVFTNDHHFAQIGFNILL